MRKAFIVIGWIEGISLLALFFYAMPLKYVWGDPSMVRMVGSAHGGLFLAYLALAFALYDKENWPRKTLMLSMILSSVPFGTWIFEKKFLPASTASPS